MSKISFLKKLKMFSFYKKTIDNCSLELNKKLNIRVDSAYRLYTVLNVPENLIGEAFSLKKSDIDKISETYIREYSIEVSNFLQSKGLVELFKPYEIKKVDKYSYLIIIGFSLFKSNIFYNTIYYKIIPITIVLSILTYFLLR